MATYPHWTKRTIQGWPWYRRVAYVIGELLTAWVKR